MQTTFICGCTLMVGLLLGTLLLSTVHSPYPVQPQIVHYEHAR